MTAKGRWASSGLVAFRLPSGFIVSGVWPSISDLTRRGVVPWSLRQAVIDKFGKPSKDKPTEEDVGRLTELNLRVASGFLSGIYDDETGEWEPLSVTFEELTDGSFPGDDIEALDTFVSLAPEHGAEKAALVITGFSEAKLGLVTPPKPKKKAAAKKEAGDTEHDWAEFRDGDGSPDAQPDGEDVGPTPISAARNRGPRARAGTGRRTRAAAAPREAAG